MTSPFLTMLVLHASLRKDLQKRLQVSQNNCVRFCLQLDKKKRIGVAEFREINWLNINDRFSQCVLSSVQKFCNSENPEYFNEFIFLLSPVTKIHGHLFKGYSNPSENRTRFD